MAEEEKKTKKAPAKKKEAAPKKEKATSAKSEKKAAPKKAAPKKKAAGKTIRVTQVGSPIGRQGYQRATLIGLGLNKMNRTSELEDTPSVRGMIAKVSHLVKIEEDAA